MNQTLATIVEALDKRGLCNSLNLKWGWGIMWIDTLVLLYRNFMNGYQL